MIGVVLWCDAARGEAVIWCEDQGDLALAEPSSRQASGVSFDAGDAVRFDVVMDQRLRRAKNVRVVAEQVAPGLAASLSGFAAQSGIAACNDAREPSTYRRPDVASSA